MPSFTLTISLTPAQLEVFYAVGANIVIAKAGETDTPSVTWQVVRPFEFNEIEWEEEYGIYASPTSLQSGAVLFVGSRTSIPAVEGEMYTFEPSGSFSAPSSGGESGSYGVFNSYSAKPYLTFGLFQAARVNGEPVPGNVASAVHVSHNYGARLTAPFPAVYVWMQSGVVTSPRTRVEFGGGAPDVALSYDSSGGHFIPAGGVELPEGASVETAVPKVFGADAPAPQRP